MKNIYTSKKLVWAALALMGASCSVSPAEESEIGEAQLFIASVPAGVQCMQITAAGARKVVQAYGVTPGQSANLQLNGLSLGTTVFSGDAFGVSCDALNAATVPEWISTPVSVNIASGAVADVALVLRRNGRAQIAVSFEDDTQVPD